MSMINCPECGKQISDLASFCPNCGFPMGFEGTRVNSNNEANTENPHPIIATCISNDKTEEKNRMRVFYQQLHF